MGDLSTHFDRSEFACPCGCGFDTVDARLIEYLEAIRQYFDRPVMITSACRCDSYNREIGGAELSQHKLGRAADIVVKDVTPQEVQEYCMNQLAPAGLGSYENFTHIDSRSGCARWDG